MLELLAVETATTPAGSSKDNVEEFCSLKQKQKKELKKSTQSEPATEIHSYAKITRQCLDNKKNERKHHQWQGIPANEQKDGFTANPKTKKI